MHLANPVSAAITATASSSNTSATISSCAPKRQPTMSLITASPRLSSACCLRTTLSAINDNYLNVQQTSSQRSLIAANCTAGATYDHRDRKAHSGAQTRQSAAARPHGRARALHPHRCRHASPPRNFIRSRRCPRPYRRALLPRVAALRSFKASRRRTGCQLPHSRRYRLLPEGYSICLVFLKLFERVYAALTAALLSPVKAVAKPRNQYRPNSNVSTSASSMISIRSSTPSASKQHDRRHNENKILGQGA